MMNIKNRLDKIENKLNINSNLCACSREIIFKVVPPEERILDEPPAVCDDCGKPVPTFPPATFQIGSIETQIIYPSIENCEEHSVEENREL